MYDPMPVVEELIQRGNHSYYRELTLLNHPKIEEHYQAHCEESARRCAEVREKLAANAREYRATQQLIEPMRMALADIADALAHGNPDKATSIANEWVTDIE